MVKIVITKWLQDPTRQIFKSVQIFIDSSQLVQEINIIRTKDYKNHGLDSVFVFNCNQIVTACFWSGRFRVPAGLRGI